VDSILHDFPYGTKEPRVLHLFSYYLGLTEGWLFNLLNNLPDTDILVASKHYFLTNFYSHRIKYIEFPIKTLMNPEKRLGRRLINALISQVVRLYPFYVRKTCGKCDLIHAHFATTGWEYLRLAKQLRVPYLVSFYGFDYESLIFSSQKWKSRYCKLFKCADIFLCEGSHGARVLAELGCPPQKIRVVRLGVDVQNVPTFRRTKGPGELRLLQVASSVEKKGQKYALEAFVMALRRCPNMSLTFVGPGVKGRLHVELKTHTGMMCMEGKVSFFEAVDPMELHNFMRDYHVFIHPSCYSQNMDCEGGAPIVLLDAQATGMPVISTTHCDIPDEVSHGLTGLLSPEKDVESLAKSIEIFYHMGQHEYDEFSARARLHVTREYDIHSNAKKLRRLYHEIISANQG